MFDFTEDKLTDERVIEIAEKDGLPPLRVAINANGYRQAQGFWGHPDASSIYEGSELAVMIKVIKRMGRHGKGVFVVKSIYEGVRKLKPFVGREIGLFARIKDELIPELDKMNLTCLIGDRVYVHPAILEESWEPNFKVYEGDHPSRLPYHLRYSEEEVEEAMKFYLKAKSLLNGK